jgi:putative SbcD/Mre11-related phosphoesterase
MNESSRIEHCPDKANSARAETPAPPVQGSLISEGRASVPAGVLPRRRRRGAAPGQTALHAFEDWLLSPEGAVIHRGERTAVIADVHLGYEWARGAAGDCVPAHSLVETVRRLTLVLDRAPITRLVVAGDLVESARPCHRTEDDVCRLRSWLSKCGVEMILVAGNHDRGRYPDWLQPVSECQTVGGWTIGHGDRPIVGPRTISGHHHPALHFEGTTAPCFLIAPGRIILPAFSRNAAGIDLLTAALPRGWQRPAFRCLATAGGELLDFGPLAELRRSLRIVGRPRLGW